MPSNAEQHATPYPVIDTDPHFKRVVSYMRPNDYLVWGGATAGAPLLLKTLESVDPTNSPGGIRVAMRYSAGLGAVLGFFLAYQRSTFRFLGISENEREIELDLKELGARAKAGVPLYGESQLTPYLQGVAARNSTNSVFKLQTMPWFNFVNHPHHGVDTSKYYEYAGVPVPSKSS